MPWAVGDRSGKRDESRGIVPWQMCRKWAVALVRERRRERDHLTRESGGAPVGLGELSGMFVSWLEV